MVTNAVSRSERGKLTTAIRVSKGLIENCTSEGDDSCDQLGDALLQRAADIIYVVGQPAQDIPMCPGVEKYKGQPGQLIIEIITHVKNGFLSYSGHKKLGKIIKKRAENIEPEQIKKYLSDISEIYPGARYLLEQQHTAFE